LYIKSSHPILLLDAQTLAMRRLRLRLPGRPRLKPPSIASWPQTPRDDSALPDVLRTSLYALKDSASAFPPLQSAVSGALALWDIAEVGDSIHGMTPKMLTSHVPPTTACAAR
jgi:hypothetical protein